MKALKDIFIISLSMAVVVLVFHCHKISAKSIDTEYKLQRIESIFAQNTTQLLRVVREGSDDTLYFIAASLSPIEYDRLNNLTMNEVYR